MAPSLLFDGQGKFWVSIGASGGTKITTAILYVSFGDLKPWLLDVSVSFEVLNMNSYNIQLLIFFQIRIEIYLLLPCSKYTHNKYYINSIL